MTRAEAERYRSERARRPIHGGDVQMAIGFFALSLVGMWIMAMIMEAFK